MRIDPIIQIKIYSIINISCHLMIFDIKNYSEVYKVYSRLKKNKLSIEDINHIILVINILSSRTDINDNLRSDLQFVKTYLNIEIDKFAFIPKKHCLTTTIKYF